MAVLAGPMLGAGRLGLAGHSANGQRFSAAPRLIWAVTSSTAILRGVDLGVPQPLPIQRRLGDFSLPQRGIFAIANAAFRDDGPSLAALSAEEPQLARPTCGVAAIGNLEFCQDR